MAENRLISALLPLLVISIAVLVVFTQILQLPYFIPEYPWFYAIHHLSQEKTLIDHYDLTNPGWYRPTAFFVYFKLISSVLGWRNIFAFQWIAMMSMVGLGLSVYALLRTLSKTNKDLALLTGVLVAIHPALFALPIALIHFDTIYQVSLLLAIALFLRPHMGWAAAGAVVLCFLVALTSKEQAIAAAAFLPAVIAIDGWLHGRSPTFPGPSLKHLAVASLCVLIAAVYLYYRWPLLVDFGSSGVYRSGLNWEVVLPNILSGFLWTFGIFSAESPIFDPVGHLVSPAGLFMGGMALGTSVAYVFYALSSRDIGERRIALILVALFLVFFSIPVFSGGMPWHYAIPTVAAMALFTRGLALILRHPRLNKARAAILGSLVIVYVGISVHGVSEERHARADRLRITSEALRFPPTRGDQLERGTKVIYVNRGDAWSFGAGYLFRYVFGRTDIDEIPLTSLADISPELRSSLNRAPAVAFFEYDPQRVPAWTDKTGWFKCYLNQERVAVQPEDTLLPVPVPSRPAATLEGTVTSQGPGETARAMPSPTRASEVKRSKEDNAA